MVHVEQIDTSLRRQVRRFTHLPLRLYAGDPHWVPPLLVEHREQLDREKHPFYAHSTADFFIAVRDGRDVGRIAAIENRPFNDFHGSRTAQFYFFECEEDDEAAVALFERVFAWARGRGLNKVIGPKGLGLLDGYGLLIEGFAGRQMMSMMTYNPPYYRRLVEDQGFEKEVDFVSCRAAAADYRLPERIKRIARRVQEREQLRVHHFDDIRTLKQWAGPLGRAYNQAFVDNWEYFPQTEREIEYIVEKLESFADPQLIKLITHGDEVVGFILAFPDIADALKRTRGRLLPFGWLRILLALRRTEWVAVNAMGITPEYRGRGGNALLYAELEETVRARDFKYAALYQVAETAVDMRRDLENLGGTFYKNHRVYAKHLP